MLGLRRGRSPTGAPARPHPRSGRVDGAAYDKYLPAAASWATASSRRKNLKRTSESSPICATAASTTTSTASRNSS